MYWHPGVQPDHHPHHRCRTLGITYGAQTTYRGWPDNTDRYTQRFSASYVTGTHTFKTGLQNEQLVTNAQYITNGNVNYTFRERRADQHHAVLHAVSPAWSAATTSASMPRTNGRSTG